MVFFCWFDQNQPYWGGRRMKYLVIGAGGTGGSISGFMTAAGLDVSVIARGEHLAAIQENGLFMETTSKGSFVVQPMKVFDMAHYQEHPDVIFVCVKGYSLEETIPFIRSVAHAQTIVIPLLNLYGTGERMQEKLPGLLVTDGCIYIAGEIKAPGMILMKGDIFKVVFGVRNQEDSRPLLEQAAADLNQSGITANVSDNIRRDALQKFTFVSPMAACGAFYDVTAGGMQQEGKERAMAIALMREIEALALAMDIHFTVDIVSTNLEILDHLAPEASSSMQRDLKKGGMSEMDGLIFEVVRLGRTYGVPVPTYEKVAEKFGFQD
jgi:2-dehydropantoate 2-reductase